MTTLFIDTSSNTEVLVRLSVGSEKKEIRKPVDRQKAQVVLRIVDELLQSYGLTVSDLQAIEVNQGPGSYTGLRVGVAIANTLSKELGIPINNKKPGTIIEPEYI